MQIFFLDFKVWERKFAKIQTIATHTKWVLFRVYHFYIVSVFACCVGVGVFIVCVCIRENVRYRPTKQKKKHNFCFQALSHCLSILTLQLAVLVSICMDTCVYQNVCNFGKCTPNSKK